MKTFIAIITLISSINASSWVAPTTIDCTTINCIDTCDEYTSCPDPTTQSCIYPDSTLTTGVCLETCGGFIGKQCLDSSDACIDSPLDDCDPDKGGADCGGFCGQGCGENEELKSCGTACPRKCGDDVAQICLAVCIPDVCRCKDGYVYDTEFGNCILEEECPTCDGANQYYNSCGSACPETCNDDPFTFCTLQCVPGCYCMDGYVLDDSGECILRGDCPTETPTTTADPTECGENEEYTTCGSACPATCTPSLGFIACPAVCVHGCFCKDGYVYNDYGECVLEEDCPTTSAPTCDDENAEYTTCGSYCPATCEDLLYHDQIQCLTVCVEGCFCKNGYVFNDAGLCIPEEECPTKDITTMTPSTCDPDCDTDKGYACVEDDGSGSAGCVMIGDECDSCYLNSFLPCDDCPDGINTYGSCGACTWQETYFGMVKCQKTLSTCPDDTTTEEPEPTKSTEESECPAVQLAANAKCDFDGQCCWGEESCCGKTYSSYCCSCFGGVAACLNTDACFGPCPSTTEATTTEEGSSTTEEDTDVTPCLGKLCGNGANTYGLVMAIGVIASAFGWM